MITVIFKLSYSSRIITPQCGGGGCIPWSPWVWYTYTVQTTGPWWGLRSRPLSHHCNPADSLCKQHPSMKHKYNTLVLVINLLFFNSVPCCNILRTLQRLYPFIEHLLLLWQHDTDFYLLMLYRYIFHFYLLMSYRYIQVLQTFAYWCHMGKYCRFLPVDVIQVHVGQEVGGQRGGVVQALNGGIHVACVTKVTETCECTALERRPKSVRITNQTSGKSIEKPALYIYLLLWPLWQT